MAKAFVWKGRHYVDVYRLAHQGMSDEAIAKVLGISPSAFNVAKKKRPAIRYALKHARDEKNTVGNYVEYVYDQLPDDLKKLWEKIQAVEDEPNAVKRAEALLQQGGKYARMHLFLYALTANNFNPSAALKAVNMRLRQLEDWIYNEPGFAQLMDEMKIHKQNFAEECLFKKMKAGDTNAIIFANKALNKDKGYDDKQTIEHKGEIKHTHTHLIDLDKLDLSLEVRKAILIAVRKQRNEKEQVPALEYRMNGNKAVPVDD